MVGIFPPPSRQFPQLAVCEELVAFYSDLSHNLDEGLNCLHFHRLKQEEFVFFYVVIIAWKTFIYY